MKEAYLVLDIGTGNVRSAVVSPAGDILGMSRDDIRYYRDLLFPDSIYFKPEELFLQLRKLTKEALGQAGKVCIKAVTSTSQREGIVLVDKWQNAVIGMPNIDHRGREWQKDLTDKSRVYQLSGRYPTSLFSVYKLIGTRERNPEMWENSSTFLSISDWVTWELSGEFAYEHSQASETLLYDVEAGKWSKELCEVFKIDFDFLPQLRDSGEILGAVKEKLANQWGLSTDAVVIVGGGDTQMAIKSTQPSTGDVILVSGTTTPVVKLEEAYITDAEERTWTSRDIETNRFVFEANAGVTGLNYQRLKEVFYPNESYDVIEKELSENTYEDCFASLGSLVATEKTSIITGGFVFHVPVSHELKRSSFVWASLVDIAFSIVENYKVLANCSVHEEDYLWACGGGLQSKVLRQLIADITGKEVRVRFGFEQATVIGSALHCNRVLSSEVGLTRGEFESTVPDLEKKTYIEDLYAKWQATRSVFRKQEDINL